MKYIVVARVEKKYYMVNVEANSYAGAEHKILDMGVCGKHEYGVDVSQAFEIEDMKTSCFMGYARIAETVSLDEITEIIEERNRKIIAKDEAENKIREIEEQMKKLSEELEAAKKILAA